MQLYLLRHAIAEDAPPGMRDADRALVPKGKEKLTRVLQRAKAAGVEPDLILTSPYRRAVETAEIAAHVLGCTEPLVRTEALIPASSPEAVWNAVRDHQDADQLLLAGHEPLLSHCVAYLLNSPALQFHYRKAGLVRIDLTSFGAQPRGVLHWILTPKTA